MSVAAIIQSDVTAFAPELLVGASAVTAGAWIDILAYVNELDLTALTDTDQETRLARIYLACHLGTVSKRAGTGAAGPVTGESAGGVRRSYGILAMPKGTYGLMSTMWGQSYALIIGTSLAHGPVIC